MHYVDVRNRQRIVLIKKKKKDSELLQIQAAQRHVNQMILQL